MALDPAAPTPGRPIALEPAATLGAGGVEGAAGVGPYRLAARRLRRNKVALAFGAIFVLMVVLCLFAPIYANDIAHTTPSSNNISQRVKVGDHYETVLNDQGIPIGPTWNSRYFFGADSNGRDVAVRLLYGGRNSLEVGALATLITVVLATIIALLSGYYRGLTDSLLSRAMDLIWAYPVVLLGIALGTALAVGGLNLGFVTINGGSLMIPALIIGVVYVPYMAKPIRGQVLSLREKEFIEAARAQGFGHLRIMLGEVLPNVASSIIVFIPLMLANAILLEAALSYLGAGIQDPNPSWGTMLAEGIQLIPTAIHLTLIPGAMLVLTVLGINVFGDGVRDALDPRAEVRIEH